MLHVKLCTFLHILFLFVLIHWKQLNQRYDLCDYMQQSYQESESEDTNLVSISTNPSPSSTYKYNFNFYEYCLTKIMDVERLHRKLGLNMFQPSDFGNLDLSYEYINTMLDYNSKQKTNNNSHNINTKVKLGLSIFVASSTREGLGRSR